MSTIALILLALIVGFIVGNRLPFWLGNMVSRLSRRSYLKDILPIPIDEYELCDGPHTWEEVNSINKDGRPSKVQVCNVCGLIPSKQLMATKEALRRMREIKADEAREERFVTDFANLEENAFRELFKEELEKGLDFRKVIQVFKDSQTFRQRFAFYRMARIEAENKPTEGNA